MGQLERKLQRFTFGGRIPGGSGFLIALTAAASLLAAVVSRHVLSLFDWAALVPDSVLHGQIWRLVTWVFFEPSPFSLIFGLVCLFWFAAPLEQTWGTRRFLRNWFGVVGIASVVTCLAALIDPAVRSQSFLGDVAIGEAMVIAWGLTFPDRVIQIYFVIPIRGRWVAWGTLAITIIYAAYAGWEHFVPNLAADAAIVAWLYRRKIASQWAAMQRANDASARRKRAQGASFLHVVDDRDRDDRMN